MWPPQASKLQPPSTSTSRAKLKLPFKTSVDAAVLEKNEVGRHASGVNAGGVRRLGRHPAEIPLSVASAELWRRLVELVGDDGGFRPTGQLQLAEDDADMKVLEQRVRQVHELGFDHERLVDRAEVRRLAPAVAPHVVGAIHVAGDGFAVPYRTTQAFRLRAEALGVAVHERTRAIALERGNDSWTVVTDRGRFSAPVLVNCAGAWGDRVAAWTGERVPLEPTGLMMMVTARVPRFIDPVIGLTHRGLSFKQMDEGTVVIGGTLVTKADREAEATVLDFTTLAGTARTVADVFPLMERVPIVRCWAGIEGFTPDDIPVIGPGTREPGVFHAFGFSAHGFQLGPIVGAILADLITRGGTDLPIDPFRIGRFQARPPAVQAASTSDPDPANLAR